MRDLADSLRYRGFQKLALKYTSFGIQEVIRSVFVGLAVKELRKYIPQIEASDITRYLRHSIMSISPIHMIISGIISLLFFYYRGPAGVRAQALGADGSLVEDFVFDYGIGEIGRSIIHCRNTPSPGATSSLAIAKMIADKAEKDFFL